MGQPLAKFASPQATRNVYPRISCKDRRRLTMGLILLFLCLPASAWAGPGPAVILPDSGTYYWWESSAGGGVVSPPKPVSGATRFTAASATGGTLYVLDTHTGEVAGLPITSGKGPISLRFADFHPLGSSASLALAGAAPAPSPAGASTPASSSEGSSSRGVGSIIGSVISWILGLIVLVGVVWFLKHLVETRGEPLIVGARKLGVDVPNPDEIASQAAANQPEGVYVPPAPREVDKVPEEVLAAAGGAPVAAPFAWGAPLPDPIPHLVGLDGPTAGQRYDLNQGAASIGRDAGNQIVINDPSISRRHASIQLQGEGFVLRDEGSANGIFVNGHKVEGQSLRPGDTVQIGRVRFKFDDQ